MGIVFIENRQFASRVVKYNPLELKECVKINFTPQQVKADNGGKFDAEATFVIANAQDHLLLIHMAMDENEKYHFGYSIFCDHSYFSILPNEENQWNPAAYDTLVSCIAGALKYLNGFTSYFGPVNENWFIKALLSAHKEINRLRLRQLTIFDML